MLARMTRPRTLVTKARPTGSGRSGKGHPETSISPAVLIPIHWGDIVGSKADAEVVAKIFKKKTVIKTVGKWRRCLLHGAQVLVEPGEYVLRPSGDYGIERGQTGRERLSNLSSSEARNRIPLRPP
jgi:hypothetical protein